jgi:hypothetical protein
MHLIPKGTTFDVSDPKLVFYGVSDGWLVDVAELGFQIWTVGTTPVQVYPGSGRQPVDLVDDRLGKGRYAATWTVPGGQASGRYEIRWFYRLALADDELRARERFEITSAFFSQGPFFAGPADLASDESVTGVTEARLIQAIGVASRAVESFTRNLFEPTYRQLALSGRGSRLLNLPWAVSAIESVTVDDELVETTDLVVFNRHLQGMLTDRGNPKLERRDGRFRQGPLMVKVHGVFGHLEVGGAPWGVQRAILTHVVKLLALLETSTMGSAGREDVRNRYRVISESTRDQAYSMSPQAGSATGLPYFVGDPEIDSIIVQLMAPMQAAGV